MLAKQHVVANRCDNPFDRWQNPAEQRKTRASKCIYKGAAGHGDGSFC